MRKLNKALLAKHTREELAVNSGIGFWTLDRIFRGVREATKTERIALCQVTGFDMDVLFPVVEDEEKAS